MTTEDHIRTLKEMRRNAELNQSRRHWDGLGGSCHKADRQVWALDAALEELFKIKEWEDANEHSRELVF